MNKREIKKLLIKRAEQTEIKDLSSNILTNSHHQVKLPEKTKKISVRKKWTISLISAVASVCLVVSFLIVAMTNIIPSDDNILSKKEQVFSREMFALGNIVSNINYSDDGLNNLSATGLEKINFSSEDNNYIIYNVNSYKKKTIFQNNIVAYDEDLTQAEKEEISKNVNYYLLTGNAFIEKSNMNVDLVDNKDSNFSQYKYKMTVSYTDSKNFGTEYVAYYNVENDDSEEEITGVIVVNEKVHNLHGSRSVEDDEVEMELFIELGKNTYVSVENETELNENEYKYSFYENGVLVKGVEMEIENENGERKLEVVMTENGITETCEFEYVGETIECCYEKNGRETEITIFIHDTYYLYMFEDDSTIRLDKTIKNEQKSKFSCMENIF